MGEIVEPSGSLFRAHRSAPPTTCTGTQQGKHRGSAGSLRRDRSRRQPLRCRNQLLAGTTATATATAAAPCAPQLAISGMPVSLPMPSLSSSSLQGDRNVNVSRTPRAAEPRAKRTGRTGSSSRSPIEWTGSPLRRSAGCQHRAAQRETGRAENKNDGDPEPRARAKAGAEGRRAGEALDSHRYACARAAEAGAVSAFRTASSSVDATNRTLWTYRATPPSATVPAEREALICSPTKARSWQSTE